METNLKIHKLHFLSAQVSEFPLIPTSSMFSFISNSRTGNFPQIRTCIKTSLPLHSLSLSSSSSPAPFSHSENSSSINEHSFEVSYLINTFGWSPEFAISKSKYLKFNTTKKPDNVLSVLNKHGFTKTQISRITERYPRLILCNPQKTLLPKLEFFRSIGLSTTEISCVVTAAPHILKRSLNQIVIPTYNLLRSLVGSDDEAVQMIKRHPMVFTRDPEVENIQILQQVGVPQANILLSMTYLRRGYVPSADTFRMMVEQVKEMGFDPSSMKFMWAIWTMRSMSKSTWVHKLRALKKYGWSDGEILLAFEKNPKFIMSSEDKIVGVMDFLINKMGVEVATVANWPVIIGMSLEKRIVPRCLVYQVLLEKGVFNGKRKLSIVTILGLAENKFISRLIKHYENEVPELLNLYQEMLDKSKCLADLI